MSDLIGKYLEAAALIILVGLVLSRAGAFATAIGAISNANVGAIRALSQR